MTLSDGRWFDVEAASRFDEDTWCDGRDQVSCATGDPAEHEILYRTAGGRWVLHHWSQRNGARDIYTEIDDDDAAQWLVRNGYPPHPACIEEYAALELK
jgi:hypothetical protein